MANLSTAEVAEQLGTVPKILRRFLRADAFYANVGCGGRYAFTADDMPTLRKRYASWSSGKAPTATSRPRVAPADGDDGFSIELLMQPSHRHSPATRRRVAELTRARDQRLIDALSQIAS